MSSISILARSTSTTTPRTPSRTTTPPRTVTEPTPPAPQRKRHWWSRSTENTELSPRVIDLQIRSVALWPRGYR